MADYSRQSFLGENSEEILADAVIGLVGYGGGGSHFGQQFSHIGVGNFIVVDDDVIEESNRPRFVGSEPEDVEAGHLKVDIAERQIKRGNPSAHIEKLAMKWQGATDQLLNCDIIFGAVDFYKERDELERFCRRNLIPYIDIGMDVQHLASGEYAISGQVIQSLPGGHCMRCCNFITDEKLKREAEKYGAAGPAPQVVWPNGVLASTAVGFGIAILSPWCTQQRLFRWLSYDGNTGELKTPTLVSEYLDGTECSHHPHNEVGDPLCDIHDFFDGTGDNNIQVDCTTHRQISLWAKIKSALFHALQRHK